MAWILLCVAGLLEVAWALCLKASKGFTVPLATVGFIVLSTASIVLLGIAMKSLPVGTAYAVWTGIGAVGTVLLGIALFGDSADPRRLACMGLILAGIVGLKFLSPH
jgi:quaternary ammonium compound-resistance protein SugE